MQKNRRFGQTDVTLKKLLIGGAPEFQALIGLPRVIEFLPGEVHEETELRVDVLAREGQTVSPYFHVEMQANNHRKMLIRMLRYQAGIAHRLIEGKYHDLTRFTRPNIYQKFVYVGRDRISMEN